MSTRATTELRRVYAAYPTGVAVVAGLVEDQPIGLAASSFIPVSLEPPLVSVCVAHSSTTWPKLSVLPRLGISVLSAQQEGVARQVGTRKSDRFAGIPWRATDDGCVLLDGAAAWFDCTIESDIRVGDHDIVVFGIRDLDVGDTIDPLVFHGSAYRTLR
jgi:flavin reductase (DIM6/NTAB) family NADH-FMN oxidoreductase RutF